MANPKFSALFRGGFNKTIAAGSGLTVADSPNNATISLDYTIAPTWSGGHIFSAQSTFNGGLKVGGVTTKQLLSVSNTGVLQANAGLYWDAANTLMGVNTSRTGSVDDTSPVMRVKGIGSNFSSSTFDIVNSAATILFFVRDDGYVGVGNNYQGDTSALFSVGLTNSAGLYVTPASNNIELASYNTQTSLYRTFNLNADSFNFKISNTEKMRILNSGTLELRDNSGLTFYTASNANKSAFVLGAQAVDINYTLPPTAPATNQVLVAGSVSGTGPYNVNLTWSSAVGGSGLTWNVVSGTSSSMTPDNGYVSNNGSLVTLTLPASAAVGQTMRVIGMGVGGWKIAQQASQTVYFGSSNTTAGTGGYLSSTNAKDCVELVCIVANTTWIVVSSVGNITIV